MTDSRTVVKQVWIETERGWGERPDGYSLHLTDADRRSYINDYWGTMPDETPDEYSRPTGTPMTIDVDLLTYSNVKESKNGIRKYQHDIGKQQ